MDDLFKKFINTGVGFLSQGNKAVQKAIEKLVQESKISEQEGKKIVDDLLKSSETKRADLEKQFKTLTEDLKGRVGLTPEGQPAAKPKAAAPKTATAKPKAAAKPAPASPTAAKKAAPAKPATSATAQTAGTLKKAADKVSAAAEKAQRSAAAKAGAPKKAPILSADDSGETLDAN